MKTKIFRQRQLRSRSRSATATLEDRSARRKRQRKSACSRCIQSKTACLSLDIPALPRSSRNSLGGVLSRCRFAVNSSRVNLDSVLRRAREKEHRQAQQRTQQQYPVRPESRATMSILRPALLISHTNVNPQLRRC
jgi:hypothetical protein